MTDTDIRKLVPPHIAALQGYAVKDAPVFAPDVLKMDLNECLAPPSPRVYAALRAALDGNCLLNWYPDSSCGELRRAIGRYLGLPADHILVTTGSNMAMEVIARAFLAAGDPVLIVSPAYAVFGLQARLQQARIEEFYFSKPFEPDFGELLDHAGKHKAIYLANPNNPTGAGYSREQVMALLEHRRDSLIVLDEAYCEFYGVTCVDAVERLPNVLVLRSFSKAFSLAGMRCGYIVGHPAALEPLHRVAAPWAVCGLSQIAARAALEDIGHMRRYAEECARARQQIVAGLAALGFAARNGHGNFILWQVPDPKRATELLAARKVFVSNKDSVPQLKGCLRVTVGTTEQADRFLAVARELQPELAT
jgi:histidinol-phosphate aminotransferase